ncbi:MAG: hypothetical protein KDK97_05365 [Verrucomicrobiales bacterium]|nr:hypothetical protein [Verrucomicrobiales bacterium]
MTSPPPTFSAPPAPLTRQAALAGWRAFLPKVAAYARTRNQVQQGQANVSRLSVSIRFRTWLEDEIIQDTLAAMPFREAEKWLQEVCWRRYWKGWLERHPQVWTQWRKQVRLLHQTLPEDLLARAEAVMAGDGGITCMDRMARELITTGYLHNHARMWWASYWIHVEGLPWELGADFFFRHLLDADPASNTLSWRWVAGLQTVGKSYLVRLSNIQKYAPEYLDGDGAGLERIADEVVAARSLPNAAPAVKQALPEYPTAPHQNTGRTGLWLHPDDLTPELGPLADLKFSSIAANISDAVYRDTYRLSDQRITSLHTMLNDGLSRAAAHFACASVAVKTEDPVQGLCAWAAENQLAEVVAFAPMMGPTHDLLPRLRAGLERANVRLTLVRRPSDAIAFSFASAGFFPFWEKMSRHLQQSLSS